MKKDHKPKQRIIRKGGRDFHSFERYDTADLRERRLQISEEQSNLYFMLSSNKGEDRQGEKFIEETTLSLNKLYQLDDELREEIQTRYRDSFKDNPAEILDVIRELVGTIHHDAFLQAVESRKNALTRFKDTTEDYETDTSSVVNFLEEGSMLSYTNFKRYITSQFFHEIAVAEYYGLTEYEDIIDELVSQYYSKDPIEEELQRIVTNPVDYFRIPKDKAIMKFWQGKYAPGQNQISLFDLDLSDGDKQKIFASVTITPLKDLPGVKGVENLSADDELIYNSIYSHYRAGNVVLTDSMIYRTLMGNKKVVTSEKQAQEIEDFINMASVTQITIDDRDRARLRGERDYRRMTTNLLSVTKVEKVEINGTVVASAWVIDKEPVLGWWAEKTGEISSVPIRVLDTGTSSNYNWLRSYLIQQITWLKNGKGKKRSNKILFDTIYKQNNITDRRYKERCRTQAFKMLDAWEDMGWITSYKPVYDAKDTRKKTPVAISIKYDTTAKIEELE